MSTRPQNTVELMPSARSLKLCMLVECTESFSVPPANSQITTWKLLTNYESSVDSLGFLLTNPYNLNQSIPFHLCSFTWLHFLYSVRPVLLILHPWRLLNSSHPSDASSRCTKKIISQQLRWCLGFHTQKPGSLKTPLTLLPPHCPGLCLGLLINIFPVFHY